MRIAGQHEVWLQLLDQSSNRGLDREHVHVRQGVRVAVPLTGAAGGVVKAEEHGRLDAETLAGQLQLFDAQRAEVVHRPDGWMRLARLAVRGTRERHPNAPFTEVRRYAPMKDLVVWMSQNDE
jgi:hypothetical protein